MVTVKFYNLLRSKYDIKQFEVNPGSIFDVLSQIELMFPQIAMKDFDHCVVFINQFKVIHESKFHTVVDSGDEVVFTHFVGGG